MIVVRIGKFGRAKVHRPTFLEVVVLIAFLSAAVMIFLIRSS